MQNDRNRKAGFGGLALAGLAAASCATAGIAAASGGRVETEAEGLASSYAAANAALMKGDARGFIEGIGGLTSDFVLMSPFGGEPSRAAEYTPDRIDRMGRFFRDGSFSQEVVASYAVKDMIVLVTIEHADVAVGGLPRQPWALRVTSVFVRNGDGWSLAHRHADPLVQDVPLAEAAKLARGERELAAER